MQGLLAKAIEKINALKSKAMVISIDIPTGVFPDTGTVKGPAVCADITYSLMGHKPGVLLYPGAKHAGRVVLLHPFQTQYRAPRLRFVVQPEAFPNLKRDRFSQHMESLRLWWVLMACTGRVNYVHALHCAVV